MAKFYLLMISQVKLYYCVIKKNCFTFGCRFQPPTPCLLPRPLWLEKSFTTGQQEACGVADGPGPRSTRSQRLRHWRNFTTWDGFFVSMFWFPDGQCRYSRRKKPWLQNRVARSSPRGIWLRNEAKMSDVFWEAIYNHQDRENALKVKVMKYHCMQWYRRPWRLLRRAFISKKKALPFPFSLKRLGTLQCYVLFSLLLFVRNGELWSSDNRISTAG